MKKIKKWNKKADLSTVFLVFMTLVVVSAALFTFVNDSGKKEEKVLSARFVEGVYIQENKINFYISETADKTLTELYSDAEDINAEEFKQRFVDKFQIYDFEETELREVENRIDNWKFQVSIEGGVLNFELKDFKIIELIENKEEELVAGVTYKTSINQKFDLTKYKEQ